MNSQIELSRNPDETMEIAGTLAAHLRPSDLIFLVGDLAAGKTVFVRGLVRSLGGQESEVDSPTFVILQTYACAGTIQQVHHIDLYRLHDQSLEGLGLEEILAEDDSLTVVEWPDDRVLAFTGQGQRLIRVEIDDQGGQTRRIHIKFLTE